MRIPPNEISYTWYWSEYVFHPCQISRCLEMSANGNHCPYDVQRVCINITPKLLWIFDNFSTQDYELRCRNLVGSGSADPTPRSFTTSITPVTTRSRSRRTMSASSTASSRSRPPPSPPSRSSSSPYRDAAAFEVLTETSWCATRGTPSDGLSISFSLSPP